MMRLRRTMASWLIVAFMVQILAPTAIAQYGEGTARGDRVSDFYINAYGAQQEAELEGAPRGRGVSPAFAWGISMSPPTDNPAPMFSVLLNWFSGRPLIIKACSYKGGKHPRMLEDGMFWVLRRSRMGGDGDVHGFGFCDPGTTTMYWILDAMHANDNLELQLHGAYVGYDLRGPVRPGSCPVRPSAAGFRMLPAGSLEQIGVTNYLAKFCLQSWQGHSPEGRAKATLDVDAPEQHNGVHALGFIANMAAFIFPEFFSSWIVRGVNLINQATYFSEMVAWDQVGSPSNTRDYLPMQRGNFYATAEFWTKLKELQARCDKMGPDGLLDEFLERMRTVGKMGDRYLNTGGGSYASSSSVRTMARRWCEGSHMDSIFAKLHRDPSQYLGSQEDRNCPNAEESSPCPADAKSCPKRSVAQAADASDEDISPPTERKEPETRTMKAPRRSARTSQLDESLAELKKMSEELDPLKEHLDRDEQRERAAASNSRHSKLTPGAKSRRQKALEKEAQAIAAAAPTPPPVLPEAPAVVAAAPAVPIPSAPVSQPPVAAPPAPSAPPVAAMPTCPQPEAVKVQSGYIEVQGGNTEGLADKLKSNGFDDATAAEIVKTVAKGKGMQRIPVNQ